MADTGREVADNGGDVAETGRDMADSGRALPYSIHITTQNNINLYAHTQKTKLAVSTNALGRIRYQGCLYTRFAESESCSKTSANSSITPVVFRLNSSRRRKTFQRMRKKNFISQGSNQSTPKMRKFMNSVAKARWAA